MIGPRIFEIVKVDFEGNDGGGVVNTWGTSAIPKFLSRPGVCLLICLDGQAIIIFVLLPFFSLFHWVFPFMF